MLMFAKMMKTFNGATGLDLGIDERVWNIREEPLIQNIKNIVPLLGNAPPTLKSAAALFFNYDVWRGRENYRGPKVTMFFIFWINSSFICNKHVIPSRDDGRNG